ncbi:MAG: hypothetical protein IAG13_27735 [Deltaproteobacteria bacterium]|nr:hypothetical protein [Nannocystaceae bacterium]
MLVDALFDPLSIAVLVIIGAMLGLSLAWYARGRAQFEQLRGGLGMLRKIGPQLSPEHPIRKRLESAPVVDLSFEEIARLMARDPVAPAARTLIELQAKTPWIDRFAQYAVHLGILGTVFALVSSDPTDLESFRAGLPTALGTTFWGLVGALGLSAVAGACEGTLEHARLHVRDALLEGLEVVAAPPEPGDPAG